MSKTVGKDHTEEINSLRQQVSELKSQLQEIKEEQHKTYTMVTNIATSQNDLETNVYKAIMKIYNKIDQQKSEKLSSSTGAKRRDMSPISFQHRSKLP